jgi:hypothetical protein
MPGDDKLSLRAAATALGATDPGGGVRVRELLRRIRWVDGHQGAGPLSAQALLHTTGTGSLRAVMRAIDAAAPPRGMREAYARLGYPLGGGATTLPRAPSVREAARRVVGPEVVPIRLLSYNTYLLPGIQLPIDRWLDDAIGWDALGWFGIPFGGALLALLGVQSLPGLAIGTLLDLAGWKPSKVIRKLTDLDLGGIRIAAKPALDARTAELGAALADYDVCCLCEVWKDEAAERILGDVRAARGDAWQAVAGPGADGALIVHGSGLRFLTRGFPVVRTERLVFGSRGERRHDSDAWTNKGAMLNVIDTGAGELELFQTHLYYGGGFADAPGLLAAPLGIHDPTDAEREAIWRAQLGELARFYRAHHRPSNVAIVTGDFNLSGADIRQYALVRRTMDELNLRDLWAWDVFDHAPADGYTCRYTDGEEMERDFAAVCGRPGAADGMGTYCNDDQPARRPRKGIGRFDFIFIENPTPAHRLHVEVSCPRRRPFRRIAPSDGELFLSDHLGLDTTLFVSVRRS